MANDGGSSSGTSSGIPSGSCFSSQGAELSRKCSHGHVEVIPLGSCKYNLKIFWTKRAGLFTKVLEALYSYNVQVLSLNTITFYGYTESFFCIEVKGEQDVVMVELRNLLSSIVEIPSI